MGGWKIFLGTTGLGFGVTLALLIGRQMTESAMSVVIGVSVGIVASIPASLILIALLSRARKAHEVPQPDAYALALSQRQGGYGGYNGGYSGGMPAIQMDPAALAQMWNSMQNQGGLRSSGNFRPLNADGWDVGT